MQCSRQLYTLEVGLSPATSATLAPSCQRVMSGTLGGLPALSRRKVGTTSSHHGPYVQGDTRATMPGTARREPARGSQSLKAGLSSDCSLQLDCMKPESLVIADQPRDRKSTRLNSSHGYISYAVFCLKKKKQKKTTELNTYTR